MKAAIVIPTVRCEQISKFLRSWNEEFKQHIVIVVEDNPERTFDLSGNADAHYSWAEIDAELGRDAWIIPRKTDCIRSFGFFKAFQQDVDLIISLDDDCAPVEKGFVSKHWDALKTPAQVPAWTSTIKGAVPRGFPYFTTERSLDCVVNHGLWLNVPDFDAITQLSSARQAPSVSPTEQVIPLRQYFPMYGMNVAFKRHLTPAMYFLLMGRDWPYDRFGDIWCGIFIKRICDHLGYAVRSGVPFVNHTRASNVWDNLDKEVTGYHVNETMWRLVDSIQLKGSSFAECYRELAENETLSGNYWNTVRKAMRIWVELFVAERDMRNRASSTVASVLHLA